MLAVLLAHINSREIGADSALLVCLVLAWSMPTLGGRLFARIETLGSSLADRKGLAIVCIAAATILIRLSLLWLLPVPVPTVHDEFSYLLAGDTFAHGRLTNPTHPMWIFFDAIHVNQHPTYMSKYPPAQGAVLALGQLLGHPWIGVILSAAAMCAAILWMLQGWLPPRWALLGGVLALLRLGIFTYWINGYWGGAVAATGGALVVGALPRILHFHRWRDAVWLALGATILANSRPFEGFILCVPVAVALLSWLCTRKSPSWSVTLPRLIFPICAVALLCVIFMGYYNWRVTGNPILPPSFVNDRTYLTTPYFIWQDAKAPLHYANPQFEDFYNRWMRVYWSANRLDSFRHGARHVATVAGKFVYFFLWPELCVPFLALPWLLRDRRTRFLVFQAGLCFLGFLLVVWFEPQYAAPVTATIFALSTQSIRHIRHWKWSGRPVGIGLSRAVVLFALILAPSHQRDGTFEPPNPATPRIVYRARFAACLDAMPGQHLVIVRHYTILNESGEWVYNAADIDHAKVVWAREIPGLDIAPLLRYYSGRQVWLAEPDADIPRLSPYPLSLPQARAAR